MVQGLMITEQKTVFWGGNYRTVPPSRQWLVWDKGAGFRGRTYAEAELAWTSFDANVRVFSYDPLARGDYKGKLHPTKKPLAVIKWCLNLAGDVQTILDPFAGRGTTGRRANDLGKKAVIVKLEQQT